MATASVSTTPECSICFEIFKTPKVLPCGHTFCLCCIERYIGDKTDTFINCPICQQDVKIPEGGAKMFITIFVVPTYLPTTQVTGTPSSLESSGITDQPVTRLKHHCPNHSKKEVEYYCQTCNLALCSKCIYRDHNDHKTLDLECDSTREMVVEEISKSEKVIKNKIEDFEKTHVSLLATSEKLKSFCDEACTEIREKTKKIIGELEENCEKRQKEIRDHFDKNESQLTETRQKVVTQIQTIKTDLDTSCRTTEEPSLTLIYSLTKLQDLQKLYENMKTDIPPVTYVEWREGSVKVCDILGSTVTKPLIKPISTVTKPLYQSSEGNGPISTVTKPLYQSSEGNGPISTVTKPLYQSRKGNGPISTEPQPLYQSSEGSGPIPTKTKPLYQSSEGSGPLSTVTKPLYQSSEGSGPISTVTKPLYQSSEGNGPITTVTKPLYQSRKGNGPISTVTKPLYQSSESSGPISTVTKPLIKPISTVTKSLYQSRDVGCKRDDFDSPDGEQYLKRPQPTDGGWRNREKESGDSWKPPVRRPVKENKRNAYKKYDDFDSPDGEQYPERPQPRGVGWRNREKESGDSWKSPVRRPIKENERNAYKYDDFDIIDGEESPEIPQPTDGGWRNREKESGDSWKPPVRRTSMERSGTKIIKY